MTHGCISSPEGQHTINTVTNPNINSQQQLKPIATTSQPINMPLPIHTTHEKPDTSETNVSTTSVRSAAEHTEESSPMANASNAPKQKLKSEAELAAEKLYEERIEDEYAKREGGA